MHTDRQTAKQIHRQDRNYILRHFTGGQQFRFQAAAAAARFWRRLPIKYIIKKTRKIAKSFPPMKVVNSTRLDILGHFATL